MWCSTSGSTADTFPGVGGAQRPRLLHHCHRPGRRHDHRLRDGSFTTRIRTYTDPSVLVIDYLRITPFDRAQANASFPSRQPPRRNRSAPIVPKPRAVRLGRAVRRRQRRRRHHGQAPRRRCHQHQGTVMAPTRAPGPHQTPCPAGTTAPARARGHTRGPSLAPQGRLLTPDPRRLILWRESDASSVDGGCGNLIMLPRGRATR